jgi:hypothetical protein
MATFGVDCSAEFANAADAALLGGLAVAKRLAGVSLESFAATIGKAYRSTGAVAAAVTAGALAATAIPESVGVDDGLVAGIAYRSTEVAALRKGLYAAGSRVADVGVLTASDPLGL